MLMIDMNMPKSCPCELAHPSDGWYDLPCFGYQGISARYKEFDDCVKNMTRPDWCPIKGELVRCGECKYFVKNTWECVRLCDRFGDEYADAMVYPDWFCADGERKDGE